MSAAPLHYSLFATPCSPRSLRRQSFLRSIRRERKPQAFVERLLLASAEALGQSVRAQLRCECLELVGNPARLVDIARQGMRGGKAGPAARITRIERGRAVEIFDRLAIAVQPQLGAADELEPVAEVGVAW